MIILIFFMFFLNINLLPQNMAEIFSKKINIDDGEYNEQFVADIIEKELGIPVILQKERDIKFKFKGFKNKNLDILLNILFESKMELKFFSDNGSIKLLMRIPEISIEDRYSQGIFLDLEDAKLKDVIETFLKVYGKKIEFYSQEEENIKISCHFENVELDDFLNFLKENYKINSEIKDDVILLKKQ